MRDEVPELLAADQRRDVGPGEIDEPGDLEPPERGAAVGEVVELGEVLATAPEREPLEVRAALPDRGERTYS